MEKRSNKDFSAEMVARFRSFSLDILNFSGQLPSHAVTFNLQGQLIRSGTSCGANYRSALRAKSKADFINKLKIVEEELDESIYFLDLFGAYFQELKPITRSLSTEAEALLKIIVAAINSSKNN